MILAVFLLFCRRGQRRALKIAFLLLTALLLFPLCGRALNGFSYATNRWCWAYSFLSCFILADLWPQLLTAPGESAGHGALYRGCWRSWPWCCPLPDQQCV